MTALVRAELRRATSRRLVRVLTGLGLLAALVIGGVAFVRSSDPGSYYDARQARDLLAGTSGILALLGWVLGASLIGAEHQSRGLTTTLTFVPQRGRVFTAKAATAVAVAAAWSLATLTAIGLALLPTLALHANDIPAPPDLAEFVGVVLRGSVLVGFAAALGFAIASLGRSTAAALGFGFAYIMVIENILATSLRGWRPWMLLGNSVIWVSGRTDVDIPGRSFVGAGLFLTVVVGALLVAGAGAFRTRDVA